MNTNKFLIGGIIGGVVYFLLGWLVWGMLLTNFMEQHTTEAGKAVMKPEADMIWWALVVANLLWGLVLSYVLVKSGVNSAGRGAATGAVLSLLIGASMQCFYYAMMNMSDTTWMAVDTLVSTVVGGIVGAVIGWYLGMGRKTA